MQNKNAQIHFIILKKRSTRESKTFDDVLSVLWYDDVVALGLREHEMRSNPCIIGVKRSKNILYKPGKAPASIVQGNKRQVV